MKKQSLSLKAKNLKISDFIVIIGFILLCLVIGIKEPTFFSSKNILNLLRQSSIIGIIAIGMTGVVISGNFDVSVGTTAAMSGAVCMKLLTGGHSLGLAILASLLTGLVIGIVNGFIVAVIGMPSLIASMSTSTVLTGIILKVTGGYTISGQFDTFEYIGKGYILGIPIPVIIFLITVIIIHIFLTYTKPGRYVFSVGGNSEASRLSGINPERIKIMIFAICGVMSAIAGIVLTSRLSTASPIAGDGYDMDAISSVVIGGTSVAGGEGSALKTVIGVLFMSVINNAFNLLGTDIYMQFIIKGLIIVLAVGADSYSRKKAARA